MPSAWSRTGQAIRPERFGEGWLRNTLSLQVNSPSLLIPLDVVSDFRWELDFFRPAMTDFIAKEFWHDQTGDLTVVSRIFRTFSDTLFVWSWFLFPSPLKG